MKRCVQDTVLTTSAASPWNSGLPSGGLPIWFCATTLVEMVLALMRRDGAIMGVVVVMVVDVIMVTVTAAVKKRVADVNVDSLA